MRAKGAFSAWWNISKKKTKHTNTDVLPREEPAWLHVYTLAHTVHVNDLLGLCKRTCQQNH